MNIFSLVGKLAIDGIDKAGRDLTTIEGKLGALGDKMTSVGKQMSLKLTAPLAALGMGAFKMSADFDTAFRKVNVMLGASAEEAEAYKERILEISSATGKSAVDVADAFYQIVSAGYRGADSLDILESAMRGAVGGAADATETTAALTKAMNIFQLEGVEGSTRAMDTFFGIVDQGLLTFEQLATSFPRAASNAAGLGISIEETGATLATLSKVLGTTEQAATATDAVLRLLISPSEAMKKLYDEWGVSSGPEAIRQFGGLTGVLAKLKDATGGEVTAIRELFASDEAMKGILPLLTSSYDDYGTAVQMVTGAQGRANEAFDEMAAGSGFQLQKAMTESKNAMIELGDTLGGMLGPIIVKVTNAVKGIVDVFSGLPGPVRTGAIVVGLLAAAMGPLLIVVGQTAKGVSALIALHKSHIIQLAAHKIATIASAAAAKIAAVAQWAWNAAMSANPLGLIVIAIAAVIAAVVLLVKNWDTVTAFFKKLWEGIKAIFWAVVDWMKEWGILFLGPIGAIIKYWDEIVGFFRNTWDKIKSIFWMVVDWVKEWGLIFLGPVGLIIKYWDGLVDFFRKIPEKIVGAFSTIKDGLLWPFRAAIQGIEIGLNWLIRQMNKIHFKLPSWVPGLGGKEFGINIPEVKLPSFQHGGPIIEDTLLYGLKSGQPYAMAHEGERVTPGGQGGEVTIDLVGFNGQLLARAIAPHLVDYIRLRTGVRI